MFRYTAILVLALICMLTAVACHEQEPERYVYHRLAERRYVCRADGCDMNILFDTGTGLSCLPSQYMAQCIAQGCVYDTIRVEKVIHHIDGVSVPHNTFYGIELPIFGSSRIREYFYIQPDGSDPIPHAVYGREILSQYVLCYDDSTITLQRHQPQGYDISIPITFQGETPCVRLTVNGIERDFVLDTGNGDGISMALSDTIYAQHPLVCDTITTYLHGEAITEVDYLEHHAVIDFGTYQAHPIIVYQDINAHPYYFNPGFLRKPCFVDLSSGVLGIKGR